MLVCPEAGNFVDCGSISLIIIDFYKEGDILFSTECMGQKILNLIASSLLR